MRVGIAILLIAPTFPAFAEQYDCQSVLGEPALTLKIDTAFSGDAYSVLAASFVVEGGIPRSMSATAATEALSVSDLVASTDDLRVTFGYTDTEFGPSTAIAHLVTVGVYGTPMTAGVFADAAGGLWTMSCTVGYAG